MRTLYEISEEAMNGNMPAHEECYYAMLAYRAMFTLDHNNLLKFLSEEKEKPLFLKTMTAENSHNMYRKALNKSPRDWLGKENDPMTEEFKKRYNISKKLAEKFIN